MSPRTGQQNLQVPSMAFMVKLTKRVGVVASAAMSSTRFFGDFRGSVRAVRKACWRHLHGLVKQQHIVLLAPKRRHFVPVPSAKKASGEPMMERNVLHLGVR